MGQLQTKGFVTEDDVLWTLMVSMPGHVRRNLGDDAIATIEPMNGDYAIKTIRTGARHEQEHDAIYITTSDGRRFRIGVEEVKRDRRNTKHNR